jgi:hypothetical protein
MRAPNPPPVAVEITRNWATSSPVDAQIVSR